MRIALAHNLRTGDGPDEAEFDDPELVATLAARLERLGHAVEPVDATPSVVGAVERVRRFGADLVFNTVEGRRGPLREALFAALLDEEGIPYTGSGPHALAVTLDKRLTKLVASAAGVPTPAAALVVRPGESLPELRSPVIVKPNFEGSSKGIDADSIVDDLPAVDSRVAELLREFPDGVLVEEFVEGRDVTVPFLELRGPLTPVEYVFPGVESPRAVYGYTLKNLLYDGVTVRPAAGADGLRDIAPRTFAALGVRDLGRADFRVDAAGRAWLLEVNPLPSLEEGAGIYVAAALDGADETRVLAEVVESAARRYGLAGA